MPLGQIPAGQCCYIASLAGSREVWMRLVNMGFTPGTPVQVICKCGSSVVVAVRDSRVVLDSELAGNVRVLR